MTKTINIEYEDLKNISYWLFYCKKTSPSWNSWDEGVLRRVNNELMRFRNG